MGNKNKLFFNFLKSKKFLKITISLLSFILIIKALISGALILIPSATSIAANLAPEADSILSLTNQERIKEQLKQLQINEYLNQAALEKAYDILKNDYFAHTNKDSKPFYIWIQENGYSYRSAGENLAISFINSEDIVNAWMKSKTHRQNILNERYQDIGIGIANGDFNSKDTWVVVQLFGEPLNSVSTNVGDTGAVLGANKKVNSLTIAILEKVNTGLTITIITTSLLLWGIIIQNLKPVLRQARAKIVYIRHTTQKL